MFDLVEIELTRVRKMAEHTRDDFLVYLIDIAIIEANAKARSERDRSETVSDDAHAFDSAHTFADARRQQIRVVS
jgi:hypothetical protein